MLPESGGDVMLFFLLFTSPFVSQSSGKKLNKTPVKQNGPSGKPSGPAIKPQIKVEKISFEFKRLKTFLRSSEVAENHLFGWLISSAVTPTVVSNNYVVFVPKWKWWTLEVKDLWLLVFDKWVYIIMRK